MNILLCGIPLGRNNVGDEAILAGVVKIFRGVMPGCSLVASTDDPSTAGRLGIGVVPLFGFDVVPYDPRAMAETIRGFDATVWAGATGLSDYPEIPCAMLSIAQAAGKKSVVWNVGMNSELNPAKYKVGGMRRVLLDAVGRATGGLANPLRSAEDSLVRRARATIRRTLEGCDLVVTRDPRSLEELRSCGVRRELLAGADSALVLEAAPDGCLPLSPEELAALSGPEPKVGFCVSAQRRIADDRSLLGWLDGLARDGFRIVMIPMNPVTDGGLLEGLRARMVCPEAALLPSAPLEPEHALALAAHCDVVVSSRLHLLILASISHVPILGISRGSKVDNFLEPYGIAASGTVESCDFRGLRERVDHWCGHRGEFTARSERVRAMLLERLETAKARLAEVLA